MVRQFVVTLEAGPAWAAGRPMEQQAQWAEHAGLMDELEDVGFVLLGGPLAVEPHTALLVVATGSEDAARARLAADPWLAHGLLRIVSIVAWQLRLGADRLSRSW